MSLAPYQGGDGRTGSRGSSYARELYGGGTSGQMMQSRGGENPFAAHHQMMRSMMGGSMLGGGLFSGGMFGGGLMQQMMQGMDDDGDNFFGGGNMGGNMSFSSFSSSSMGGDGQPHVVQYSSSTTMGPGGVRETKKTFKDSRSGDQRMQHERAIGERGRRITQSRNAHTGEEVQDDAFLNMNEDEASQFDEMFAQQQRSRAPMWGISSGPPRLLGRPTSARPASATAASSRYSALDALRASGDYADDEAPPYSAQGYSGGYGGGYSHRGGYGEGYGGGYGGGQGGGLDGGYGRY